MSQSFSFFRQLGFKFTHRFFISLFVFNLLNLISSVALADNPFGINYQGRIYKTDNQPLVANSVDFYMRLSAPRGNCVLYSEIVRSSMSSGDGSFSVVFGKSKSVDSGEVPFAQLFSSNLDFPPSRQCLQGYKKLPGDTLSLYIAFNDGAGYQPLSPMEISPSPFSLDTINVAGVSSENVLRIKDGPAREFTQAEFTELEALIAGTSTKYASANGANIDLSEEAIPRLSKPDKVSGNAIITGTISGDTSLDTSGDIKTTGQLTATSASISAISANSLVLNDTTTPLPKTITLMASATVSTPYVLRLPPADGTLGQVLQTNGSGQLSWQTINTNYLDSSWTGSSQLTTVGTLTTGTWNASTITVPYGGTGLTNGTSGGLPYFSSATTMGSSGALTQYGLVYGGGAGQAPSSTAAASDGQIFIGQTGAPPAPLSLSGDAALSKTGAVTVNLSGNTTNKILGSNPGAASLIMTDALTGSTVVGLPTAMNSVLVSGAGPMAAPTWASANGDLFNQYALLAGRPGGQTLRGGTNPSETLTLDSTSDNSKGSVLINPTGGFVGIGTTTPQSTLDVAGTLRLGNSAMVNCGASTAGAIRYNMGIVEFCNGTSWSAFATGSTAISTLNGSANPSQSFAVPGTSGTAPNWSTNTSSGVHTLNLPMASGAGVSAGLISKSEYESFNAKLDGNDNRIVNALQKTGDSMSGTLTLATGTSSLPPLNLPSGVLVGNPLSGNIENDGSNLFWTNAASARQKFAMYPEASTPSNGQLMIGNGSGFSIANLSAGTGVSINNTSGGITISATGTGGTVTSVASANSDIAVTNTTTTPVLTLNSGTTGGLTDSNKIAKLDANGQLTTAMIPDLDVSKITGGVLPVSRGGTNSGTALVNNQLMVSNSGAIKELGAMTDGQVIVGKTGSPPQIVSLSGDLSITNAGVTTIDKINGTAITGVGLADKNILQNNSGSTIAANSVLVSNSAGSGVTALTTPATGVLLSNGSVPTWTNLSADTFTQYALLAGRAGGQILNGGSAANENLALDSTGNAAKGFVLINPSGGKVGIGTTNPQSKLDVAGSVKVGTDLTSCSATISGSIRLNSNTLEYCNGTAWTALAASGSGIGSLNGLTSNTQTFAIGTAGTAPVFNSTSSTHTLNIPMASSAGVTAGLVSKTDYDSFAAKLSPSSTFAGDVSGTYSATIVDKIKNIAVSATAPLSGQFLVYNGTTQYTPISLNGDVTMTNTGATTVGKINGTAVSGVGLASNNLLQNTSGSAILGNSVLVSNGTATGVMALTTPSSGVLIANGTIPTWTSLSSDSFLQYALLGGRAGGQILKGGTAASENLTLDSTSNGTKGNVLISPTGGNVGIGTNSPAGKLHIRVLEDSAAPALYIQRANNSAGGAGNPEIGIQVDIPNTYNNAGTVYGLKVLAKHNLGGVHYGGYFEAGGSPYSNGVGVYAKVTHTDTNGPGFQPAIFADAYSTVGASNAGYAVAIQGNTNDYVNNINLLLKSNYTGVSNQKAVSIVRNGTEVGSIQTSQTNSSYLTSPSAGLVGAATDVVTINTANTERLRVSSTGSVGIGTTNPSQKLHVAGNILLDSGANTDNYISTPVGQDLIFQFGTPNQAGYGQRTIKYSVQGGGYARVDYGGGGTYQYDPYGSVWHMGWAGISFTNAGGFSGTNPMAFNSSSGFQFNNGSVGIGTTSPTAKLHLTAGSATAGTAPLKLTAGTNLTTPEAGALEFDGTSLYFTDSTNTRRTLGVAGAGLMALTGDVSASGSGSVAATVNSVGGSTALNVHNAELLANAATNLNTASTIVKRDASGNFSAGTITANLTGNVTGSASLNVLKAGDTMTGNLTFGSNLGTIFSGTSGTVTLQGPAGAIGSNYVLKLPTAQGAANQHLVNDGSGNLSWQGYIGSITANSPLSASTTGTATTLSLGTVPIANGGTGATTQQAAINALAGAVTSGQFLRGNGTNVVMSAIQAADLPSGTVAGSGTAGYIPYYSAATTLANSPMSVSGTNVGIGVASPTAKFSVYANANDTPSVAASNVYLRGANQGGGLILGTRLTSPVGAWIQTTINDAASTSPLLLNPSGGNVGIGTTNPVAPLNILNPGAAGDIELARFTATTGNPYLTVGASTAGNQGGYVLWDSTNGLLRLGPHGQSGPLFLKGANVGVGNNTPGEKLTVTGGNISATSGNLHTNRGRVAFSSTATDPNHTIYNNYLNIDSEGAWDGMKMNVFSGLNVRVGQANPGPPTSALFVNSNGNIGFGTTSPSTDLEIRAPLAGALTNFTQSVSSAGILIDSDIVNGTHNPGLFWKSTNNNPTKPKAGVWMYQEDGPGSWLMFGTSNSYLTGITNQAMTINPSGNVGIGTTNATGKLQIAGTFSSGIMTDGSDRPSVGVTGVYPQLVMMAGGSGNINHGSTVMLGSYDAGTSGAHKHWSIGTAGTGSTFLDIGYHAGTDLNPHAGIRNYNGSTFMTINNSGFVGVGTLSPLAKLQVAGGAIMPATGNATTAGIQFPSDPGGGGGDEAFLRYYAVTGESTKFMIGTNNDADDTIGFWQAGAERMTVYNGAVGIGTTLPGYPLDVITSGTGAAARFKNASTTSGAIAIFNSAYAASCYLSTAGNLYCSSDVRLKKDIDPINDALEGILKLDGVRYHLNEEKSTDPLHVGFKAQQIKEVFPEVVSTDEKGFLQVSYAPFVAVVTQALKEFYQRWFDDSSAIHQELKALQDKNAQLEASQAEKDRQIASLKAQAEETKKENAAIKARLERIEKVIEAKH